MPRILYGISPIGLGHATRSEVIISKLRSSGAEVRVFSGGKAADFLKSEGVEVDNVVAEPLLDVRGGEMKGASIWYIRSWLVHRGNVARVTDLVDEYKPDVVVGDEEFSGMAAAEKRGVRRAFISDELELGFAKTWIARRVESRVERWYSRLQESVDLLLVPEFGRDSGNVRYVGPVVRPVTKRRAEVLAEHGLPEGKMVLFCMSGSGLGAHLLPKVLSSVKAIGGPGIFVVVVGNRGPYLAGESVFDLGVVRDNQNIIAAADLVVSTAGKSTIDEAAASGTPIIAIPIKNHAEQERNAAALGFSSSDADRLGLLVREKLGRRTEPKEYLGEERAVKLLLSAVC